MSACMPRQQVLASRRAVIAGARSVGRRPKVWVSSSQVDLALVRSQKDPARSGRVSGLCLSGCRGSDRLISAADATRRVGGEAAVRNDGLEVLFATEQAIRSRPASSPRRCSRASRYGRTHESADAVAPQPGDLAARRDRGCLEDTPPGADEQFIVDTAHQLLGSRRTGVEEFAFRLVSRAPRWNAGRRPVVGPHSRGSPKPTLITSCMTHIPFTCGYMVCLHNR